MVRLQSAPPQAETAGGCLQLLDLTSQRLVMPAIMKVSR
jgi:hypothetical protein